MKNIALFLIALLALVCSIFDEVSDKVRILATGPIYAYDRPRENVSFYELLVDKSSFIGKEVVVSGFFVLLPEGEPAFLYANKEDAGLQILSNGVAINGFVENCQHIDFSLYSGKYVSFMARVAEYPYDLLDARSFRVKAEGKSNFLESRIC